ncbi:MAG: hypothetical protein ACP5N0_08820 [Methanosarcina sp.]
MRREKGEIIVLLELSLRKAIWNLNVHRLFLSGKNDNNQRSPSLY